MSIKQFFPYLLIASLLLFDPLPVYTTSETLTGSLKYMVIIDGYDPNNQFNTITLQCIVTMHIVDNKLESAEATNVTIESIWFTPSKRLITSLLRDIFLQWFNMLKLFDRTDGIDKTYLSVNGKIIEANIVTRDNGTEYREVNTGLFVGGDQFMIYRFIAYGRSIDFVLSIVSYLIEVTPENILTKLFVVEPPVLETRTATLAFAFLIIALAALTISKWEYYSIM
ncbi:MAG: hypothetical protein J7L82_01725 [Staphylothermus sp.]|nr:hypothetical protein [Staphylothermus sp.]